MKIRNLTIAGVAAAALLLTGCTTDSSNSGPVTLQFIGPETPTTFDPVIKGFEAKNPNITVKYTQVPQDQLSSTLQQRLSAKDTGIDVYTVDQPRVSELAAQGFLTDLSDLKDQVKSAVAPDQYEVNIYKDKMWALPIWTSTQLMFYNKDALDKAGVAAPSINPDDRWTWEQVADAGQKAQAAGGVASGLLFEQVELYYMIQQLAESAGGGSGLTGDNNLTPDITNAGWVKAMNWYSETFKSGLQPRGVGGFDTGPVFSNGKVAFFIGGPWDVSGFAKSANFNWGIAPMPYFSGGKVTTPTGSWSWGISPYAKNKDAAKKFIEYAALDSAGNLSTTEATTIIPSNLEAAKEYLPKLDAAAGTKSQGVSELITHEMKSTAVARPTTVGYLQFEDIMDKAFGDIRNGADVQSRLSKAQDDLKAAFAKLQ